MSATVMSVAEKLVRSSDNGSTVGAINFIVGAARRNVPGVLMRVNEMFSSRRPNIGAQHLRTDTEVGYMVSDIVGELDEGQRMRRALEAIEGTIRVRYLY